MSLLLCQASSGARWVVCRNWVIGLSLRIVTPGEMEMTDAADRARVANCHFLRARISTADPALMELTTGFGAIANAVEALAVQLAEMKQGFLSNTESVN
jgi:hypothetical protein